MISLLFMLMYNIESVNIHCHHIRVYRRMCMCVYICVCSDHNMQINQYNKTKYCTKILYTQFASLSESSSLLSLHQLNAAAQSYFDLGISDATRKAYKTGLNKYRTFCSQFKQSAVPATEDTLVLFITHLAKQQLSYSTIQVYLSAVRYLHVANQEYQTFTAQITPQIN